MGAVSIKKVFGLKTFIIIKTLLETGALRENGVLILDEPEIHLHPKWQLLFAEIIVLLHKEFGMYTLINTHSPYFIEAIEVYSKKYGISNCKYYLAENISEYVSEIRDVSDETELIFLFQTMSVKLRSDFVFCPSEQEFFTAR